MPSNPDGSIKMTTCSTPDGYGGCTVTMPSVPMDRWMARHPGVIWIVIEYKMVVVAVCRRKPRRTSGERASRRQTACDWRQLKLPSPLPHLKMLPASPAGSAPWPSRDDLRSGGERSEPDRTRHSLLVRRSDRPASAFYGGGHGLGGGFLVDTDYHPCGTPLKGRFSQLPRTIVKLNSSTALRGHDHLTTFVSMKGSSEKTSLRAAAARHVFNLRCKVRS